MVVIAINKALSSTRMMFCRPNCLSTNMMLLVGLYMLKPTVLSTMFSSGALNDPSMVYMHCSGLNLSNVYGGILLVRVVLYRRLLCGYVLGWFAPFYVFELAVERVLWTLLVVTRTS